MKGYWPSTQQSPHGKNGVQVSIALLIHAMLIFSSKIYDLAISILCVCMNKWVRSWNCDCLVTWFCYQLIAKPGNKTVAVPWHDSIIYTCFLYFVFAAPSSEVTVKLNVGDINDNPPRFLLDPVIVGVSADSNFLQPITALQVSAFTCMIWDKFILNMYDLLFE